MLLARQAGEAPFLDEVRGLGTRFAVVPWVTSVPRGARELGNLVGATEAGARATAEAR